MTTNTARDKVTKARAGLILDQPFFGSLALRLKVVEDATCKTMYTDGTVLGYNPEWVNGLTLDETKGVICHEVMHCAVAHHARRGARDPKKFNVAGDYAINGILEKVVTLPKAALINHAYDGMSAEEIYTMMPEPDQDGKNGQGQGQGSGSDGDDDQPGDSNQDDSPDPGGCGEVRDAKGQGQGQDGSNPATGQPDDAQGNSQASPADMSKAEQDWKIAVSQAATQAKNCGKLPGGLDRLIQDILAPKVDWRETLRRFIDQASKNDYSWSRPNRRFVAQGMYLPSAYSEELAPVVIGVDTSGSIGQEELSQFASEITSILEQYRTTAHVIYCDADVAGEQDFTPDDLPLTLDAKGGGGTDFRPVFDRVETRGIVPSCLIYLTDLYCNGFPKQPPDYPVLWVVIGDNKQVPPFGEAVPL